MNYVNFHSYLNHFHFDISSTDDVVAIIYQFENPFRPEAPPSDRENGLYDRKMRMMMSTSVYENLYITHAQSQAKPSSNVLLYGLDAKR